MAPSRKIDGGCRLQVLVLEMAQGPSPTPITAGGFISNGSEENGEEEEAAGQDAWIIKAREDEVKYHI